MKTENIINLLNPKIRGWTNYYRNVVASKIFSHIDSDIFKAMWGWMKRRHPNKSGPWKYNKYFKTVGLDRWQFYAIEKDRQGIKSPVYLINARKVAIRRHIKIRAIAHPFNPEFKEYFKQRDATNKTRQA